MVIKMDLSNININEQSSIRIAGSKVLHFDAFKDEMESHDADIIFVTHEHFGSEDDSIGIHISVK